MTVNASRSSAVWQPGPPIHSSFDRADQSWLLFNYPSNRGAMRSGVTKSRDRQAGTLQMTETARPGLADLFGISG